MRAFLAAVALLAFALPAPGAAQAEAWYNVDGVDYYYAAGTHASGRFAVGPDADSQALQPFAGCGWAKLRPDLNKGRIQALGTWGILPIAIDMSAFPAANRTPDGMAADATVPADATGTGQPVRAAMMATADATVRLGPTSVPDPVTGSPKLQATWYVTPQGFRYDGDGSRAPAPADAEAWEMHLRVRSPPDAPRQEPASWSRAEPADGSPFLVREEPHSRLFTLPNERLFGKATLSAEATSLAPEGSTDLEFTVYAPDGSTVGTLRLAPAAGQPATQALEFPLDQFGDYHVEVHGPASLATYALDVRQDAPESFVLDLWWDDVRPGHAGLEARNECSTLVGGEVMTAYIPPRPPPVPFDWKTSLFTVAAGLTLLVVTVTLGVAGYQMAAARRAVQG